MSDVGVEVDLTTESEVDLDVIDKARRVVAANCADARECRILLEMLGIGAIVDVEAD